MKFNILTFGLIIVAFFAQSQNNIDGYLQAVALNNTGIKAAKQNLEAQTAGYKTNIAPANPEIEYGYFPGNTDAIGVKEVFSISQSFEFPTVYTNKISLRKKQTALAENYFDAYKMETLFNAKQLCYEFIYHSKLNQEYKKRLKNAEELLNAYQSSFKLGRITIIEFNKIKFQWVEAQNELRTNEEKTGNIEALLTLYNGGSIFEFTDTTYFEGIGEPLDSLIYKNLSYSPQFLATQEEANIVENEIKLSKSQWLPDFNVGYESETIQDEKFAGIKAGISIPLWENSNEVQKFKLEFVSQKLLLEDQKNKIITEITNKYNLANTLKKNLDEMQNLLLQSNSENLLIKSLDLGEISIIDYFIELSYYYDVKDTYLELEREYFQALAELNKTKLLSIQ
ncbi:TolC family protein [Bacteroidota bacterium]